jgi:hypothetical protein
MPTVITVNGKTETLLSLRDFQDLIDKHMGIDSMRFFRELVDELEELRTEKAELEKEVEELEVTVREQQKARQ